MDDKVKRYSTKQYDVGKERPVSADPYRRIDRRKCKRDDDYSRYATTIGTGDLPNEISDFNQYRVAMTEISRQRFLCDSEWKKAVCSQLKWIAVDLPNKSSPDQSPNDNAIITDSRPKRHSHIPEATVDDGVREDIKEVVEQGLPVSVSHAAADDETVSAMSTPESLDAPLIENEKTNIQMGSTTSMTPVLHAIPRYDIGGDLPCYFRRAPTKVLLVKRIGTPHVTVEAVKICNFLTATHGMDVFAEPDEVEELSQAGAEVVHAFDQERLQSQLDFIITLGGDGTLLWLSELFPRAIPPVLSVSMGSLGYLAQYDIEDIANTIETVINQKFQIQLRCRLHVSVYDDNNDDIVECAGMNECVLDRGGSPHLTSLDVYCNGSLFTTVVADGIVIATPSGSTAYSMSAGGSIVHPKVPCILFTPICPHSLSFRPVILPDSIELKLYNSSNARASSWMSVDGRRRIEIKNGMYVVITMSAFPLPLIVPHSSENDPWLHCMKRIFNWNYATRYGAYQLGFPKTQRQSTLMPIRNLSSSTTQGTTDETDSSYALMMTECAAAMGDTDSISQLTYLEKPASIFECKPSNTSSSSSCRNLRECNPGECIELASLAGNTTLNGPSGSICIEWPLPTLSCTTEGNVSGLNNSSTATSTVSASRSNMERKSLHSIRQPRLWAEVETRKDDFIGRKGMPSMPEEKEVESSPSVIESFGIQSVPNYEDTDTSSTSKNDVSTCGREGRARRRSLTPTRIRPHHIGRRTKGNACDLTASYSSSVFFTPSAEWRGAVILETVDGTAKPNKGAVATGVLRAGIKAKEQFEEK